MKVINPATEELIGEVAEHSGDQIEGILVRAGSAFETWRRKPIAQRAEAVGRLGAVLRKRKGELAELAAREMGKPIVEAEAEVEKCAMVSEYFAGHGSGMLANEATGLGEAYLRFDPMGAVLGVMPWNFPFIQVIRFAVPTILAGNVAVLKHAPNVPECAVAIESAFAEAGFEAGVFSNVLVSDRAATEGMVAHRSIRGVTLTGSERAGSAVAAAAGRALKKSVMELGGSDAFIVLRDVNVEEVARQAAAARCMNSGQSCIAPKRFIVEEGIVREFEAAMEGAMREMKVGDPMDRATRIGPLARLDLLEGLQGQVRRTIEAGGKLLCGGRRREGRGFYYEATVLGDVKPGMAAFDEETFGPVAAIVTAKDARDAVRLANLSRYGLGGTIWTRDIELAKRLAGEMECGMVFINGAVKSDPRLPFGGVKNSGWGKEMSALGIREFVNAKMVYVTA